MTSQGTRINHHPSPLLLQWPQPPDLFHPYHHHPPTHPKTSLLLPLALLLLCVADNLLSSIQSQALTYMSYP